MKFLPNNTIELDRELSLLDRFTLDFLKILEKHTSYVVVSGYVSILLGRARISEDVDIFMPKIDFLEFSALLAEISQNKFYCLNAEEPKEVYNYLKDNIAVRFAKNNTVIPNIELKFAKSEFDLLALKKTITVKVGKENIIISHLELQIAFKEIALRSPKDLEDAKHIRDIAKGHLDEKLIEGYKRALNGIYGR
jgi:hypothetical protein